MIPKVMDGVKIRREEFGGLVFTNRTPVLALNEDAMAIWDLIDGRRLIEEIAMALPSASTDKEGVAHMVNEFIRSCVDLGLIETDAAPFRGAGTTVGPRT